mmetsp:Transcript_86848/g.119620  ORF Transcript_86848/g.119620 Transcript_86848/m.119620 type:complete len:211 (+) Transcript_86848:182-814(+)
MDFANSTFSLVSCIIYIYYTYNIEYFISEEGYWYQVYLAIVHCYFLLDYILRLMTVKNVFNFFLQTAIIEVTTTIPFILMLCMSLKIENFWYRLTMMLDLLRMRTLARLISKIYSDLVRQFSLIIFDALYLIIVATAFIQLVESEETFPEVPTEFTFHKAAFFCMTSISIIGYGSSVVTDLGRVFLIFLLLVVMVVIPISSSNLVTIVGS